LATLQEQQHQKLDEICCVLTICSEKASKCVKTRESQFELTLKKDNGIEIAQMEVDRSGSKCREARN
jgi:hypothetical protein